MSITPSFFWNNTTQRILSQSNNISYAARGVYRVYDTEPNRKGDYWFRDFGMVMACAYLTELGFRAVETLYTIPLASNAMKLDQLSKLTNPVTGQELYPGARNYRALPNVVRDRVLGSLIRNSSNLVPKLTKELELGQSETLQDEEVKKTVQTLLKNPVANADSLIQPHLQATGLQMADIKKISRIENKTLRDEAITALHQKKHRGLNRDVIANAVKLEDARQMGILLDHLQKNLNFSEYLKEKYLSSHKLSSTVAEVLQDYSDKLSTMQNKGKNELPTLVQDLLKLPVGNREAEFIKRFADIESSLELRKGVLLATEEERHALRELGKTIKTQLTSQKTPVNMPDLETQIENFYTQLKKKQDTHLQTLWEHHAIPDIKTKIAQKIEAVVDGVQKLEPGKGRHEILLKKLDDLGLGVLTPESNSGEALQTLKQSIKEALPDDPAAFIKDDHLDAAKKQIRTFTQALPSGADGLLSKLMKQAGSTAQEFQRLIIDGIDSKVMSSAVKQIQTSGTWPKMAATVLLNLFFYGYLASNFDNKILQPFQQKLVAERGTAQDIVTAGYMGLVPGLAVLTQLVDKTSLPIFRRMGYLGRFAVVGGAALATFAGSTYAFLMQRLNAPPAYKPPTPAQPPNPFYHANNGLSFKANPVPMAPISAPMSNFQSAPTFHQAFQSAHANNTYGFASPQATSTYVYPQFKPL